MIPYTDARFITSCQPEHTILLKINTPLMSDRIKLDSSELEVNHS